MIKGFLIKYTDECPHSELRGTWLRRNNTKNVHEFSIFDSMQSAERTLRRLHWREYAVIIGVDLTPTTMFVPTADWFQYRDEVTAKRNAQYRERKAAGKLDKYGNYEQYRKVRAYRPEDLNKKQE